MASKDPWADFPTAPAASLGGEETGVAVKMPEQDPWAAFPTKPETSWRAGPLGGVVRGLLDLPDAGAQLLTRGGEAISPAGSRLEKWFKGERENVENINREREAEYRKYRPDAGLDIPRIAGNVVAAGPVTSIGKVATTLGGRAAQGAAAGGAATALTMPVEGDDYWKEKAKQTGIGAGAGAVMAPIIGGVARLISPKASTDRGVQTLLNEDVRLTPGQMLGGLSKRGEDAITSVPILGDVVRSAQRRGVEDLNRAALNRVLEPIGKTLPKDIDLGRDAVKFVHQEASGAFNSALPKLNNTTADTQFVSELLGIVQGAQKLPPEQGKQLGKIIEGEIVNRFVVNKGKLDGLQLQRLDSELNSRASNYLRSGSAADREFGQTLREVHDSLLNLAERTNPKAATEEYQAAKAAWAQWKVIEKAASAQGSTEGIFSPLQLSAAAKSATRSNARTATGTGRMQDLTDAARAVMPSSVPDSGTALRAMTGYGLLGGGAMVEPTSTAVAASLASMYAPGVRKIPEYLIARRPGVAQALAERLRANTPLLASPGGLAAYGLLN